MYNNPYMVNYPNNYNQQSLSERIDNQIAQLNQMKEQIKNSQHGGGITQNFQLAPTNRDVIKYASSIDEVQRDMVIGDTPYFSKDMSVVWIKNTKGDIKTYELVEIIPKDSKDLQIELLQNQIEELKKEVRNNERTITNVVSTEDDSDTEERDEPTRNTVETVKPASVSRIPKSKKG